MSIKNDIEISIICASRGRPRYLRRGLVSVDIFSSYPEKIEYMIWVDSDDDASIECMKRLKDEIPNVRFFICPRVGFSNLWFSYEHLINVSDGKIMIPWSDDYYINYPYWDEPLYQFVESDNLICWGCSFMYTKKFVQDHNLIDFYKVHTQMSNERIFGYAMENKITAPLKKHPYVNEIVTKVKQDSFIHRLGFEMPVPQTFDILSCENI